MVPLKFDHLKRLITLTVITLSGFHCITLGGAPKNNTDKSYVFSMKNYNTNPTVFQGKVCLMQVG